MHVGSRNPQQFARAREEEILAEALETCLEVLKELNQFACTLREMSPGALVEYSRRLELTALRVASLNASIQGAKAGLPAVKRQQILSLIELVRLELKQVEARLAGAGELAGEWFLRLKSLSEQYGSEGRPIAGSTHGEVDLEG